jgi:hypothetical protein
MKKWEETWKFLTWIYIILIHSVTSPWDKRQSSSFWSQEVIFNVYLLLFVQCIKLLSFSSCSGNLIATSEGDEKYPEKNLFIDLHILLYFTCSLEIFSILRIFLFFSHNFHNFSFLLSLLLYLSVCHEVFKFSFCCKIIYQL